MERRRFTAELDWDENGQLYSIEVPDAKKYVGKPSPEIDANWAELIPGENCHAHRPSNFKLSKVTHSLTIRSSR